MNDEVTVNVSEQKINDMIDSAKENIKDDKYPYLGYIDAYRYVINTDDIESILDKLREVKKKEVSYYNLYKSLKPIPFVGVYIQSKAWYYDGYSTAICDCINAHLITHSDENGNMYTRLIDDETENIRDTIMKY